MLSIETNTSTQCRQKQNDKYSYKCSQSKLVMTFCLLLYYLLIFFLILFIIVNGLYMLMIKTSITSIKVNILVILITKKSCYKICCSLSLCPHSTRGKKQRTRERSWTRVQFATDRQEAQLAPKQCMLTMRRADEVETNSVRDAGQKRVLKQKNGQNSTNVNNFMAEKYSIALLRPY